MSFLLSYHYLSKIKTRHHPVCLLGYHSHHWEYRCLYVSSYHIVIYQHVVFDGFVFLFGSVTLTSPVQYTFLDDLSEPSLMLHDVLDSCSSPTIPPPFPSLDTAQIEPPPHFHPPWPTHSMNSHAWSGIIKYIERYWQFTISHVHNLTYMHYNTQTKEQPQISNIMNYLEQTWIFVPRPLGSIWFDLCGYSPHKHHFDKSLAIYNTCLVANGHSQQWYINCDQTFRFVDKVATIHIISSYLLVSRYWPIHQLDMNNSILKWPFI